MTAARLGPEVAEAVASASQAAAGFQRQQMECLAREGSCFDMRAHKLTAGMVITGGLAAAALGIGAGTAAAAPGPATGPIPAWGGHGWGHHDGGWGPPGGGWNPNEGPWGPAGWNGGWQPPGAVCLGQWCL